MTPLSIVSSTDLCKECGCLNNGCCEGQGYTLRSFWQLEVCTSSMCSSLHVIIKSKVSGVFQFTRGNRKWLPFLQEQESQGSAQLFPHYPGQARVPSSSWSDLQLHVQVAVLPLSSSISDICWERSFLFLHWGYWDSFESKYEVGATAAILLLQRGERMSELPRAVEEKVSLKSTMARDTGWHYLSHWANLPKKPNPSLNLPVIRSNGADLMFELFELSFWTFNSKGFCHN